MLQASLAFSLMALCVKFASQSLPSHEVVFFRSLIGSIMVYTVMRHKKIPVLGKETGLMIFRGIAGFLALSLFFFTIAHLPLGMAVLLNYASPIFSAILAMIFLKERPSLLIILMIALSFFGVYLLVGEGAWESKSALYVITGLLSAVCAATAYVLIRAIRHRESELTVIFYFTAISTVGSCFFIPLGFVMPDLWGWLGLLGVGIGSYYGQVWMTRALRLAPAAIVSPFSYSTPLLSYLYGLCFFGEHLELRSLAGALIIIASGSVISYCASKIKS